MPLIRWKVRQNYTVWQENLLLSIAIGDMKQQYIAVCVVLLPESIVALQESIGRFASVWGPPRGAGVYSVVVMTACTSTMIPCLHHGASWTGVSLPLSFPSRRTLSV